VVDEAAGNAFAPAFPRDGKMTQDAPSPLMTAEHGTDDPALNARDKTKPLVSPEVNLDGVPAVAFLKTQTFGLLPKMVHLAIIIDGHLADAVVHTGSPEQRRSRSSDGRAVGRNEVTVRGKQVILSQACEGIPLGVAPGDMNPRNRQRSL